MKKAVALKYPDGIEAPIIVAKGEGKIAEKIIETAQQNEIYIEENEVLVDMLGLCNTGDIVPENTWNAIAKIFGFILQYEK